MHQPTHTHRIVAEQRLVNKQRVDENHARQTDQNDARDQRKSPAFIAQECLTRLVRKPVDDIAHEGKKRHFDNSDQCRENCHADNPWPCATGVIKAKGYQPARRLARRFFGISFESFFKPFEHGDPFTGTLQNFQVGTGTKREYFRDARMILFLQAPSRELMC